MSMETEPYFSDRPLLNLFEFETVEAPVIDAVPAGDEPSPDAAPAPDPGAPDDSLPPSGEARADAPAWDPTDPAFRDAIRQEAEALVQAQLAGLQTALIGDEPAAAPPALDPFSETFGADLQALLRAELAQISGPLEARQQAETNAEGERRIQDMISDDLSRNGDLSETGKAQIRPLLDVVFPEIAATYGSTARAAEMAVQKATGIVRQIEADAEARAVEKYKNQLGTLAGAPGELGAGPTNGAVGATGLTQAQSIQEVINRHAPLLQSTRPN